MTESRTYGPYRQWCPISALPESKSPSHPDTRKTLGAALSKFNSIFLLRGPCEEDKMSNQQIIVVVV